MSAYKTDGEGDGEWFIVELRSTIKFARLSSPLLRFLINTIFVQMNFILDCLY